MAKKKKSVIEVTNPATGDVIGSCKSHTAEEGRAAIERARAAQKRWAAKPLKDRIAVIRRFKDILLDRAEELCELVSQENGKVLQESFQMEVFPIVDLANYFCSRAPDILAKKQIPLHLLKHRRSYLHYKPRGVLLIISPWNFPFSIPFGEVIMALLAGNAVVLKPASLTPLIALKGRELFDAAGLDPDVFQVLPCPGRVASEMIEMGVDYVNFTGSTGVGVQVAATCGKNLIPCSMELGGKDPAIVLPDADLDIVVGSLVWGAFANAGQVCASIERAYVHESLYDEVVRRVTDRVNALKVGDPFASDTDMGPMTDPGQLDQVIAHVDSAAANGATILTGGKRLDGPGQFFPPTVMVDVDDEFEAVKDETFGPTLPIMSYRSVDDAIARANNSPFGLNAYVYGKCKDEMRRVAEQLEAGTVMTNETLFTHACPETPWGGVKMSGVGRVHSDDGLKDLCIAYHVNEEVLPTMKWSPFWQPYSNKMYKALIGAARMLQHSELGEKSSGAIDFAKNVSQLIRNR
jgi:acyl-CoA reductase-like NAD-dependent aldehyde dehydrogenase